ncbi:MAG: cation transporter [Acidobacteriota bacterium]|nr:cation transporter [Acidobacteriota bacterium]
MRLVLRTLCISIVLIAAANGAFAEGKPQRVALTINGMHCKSCATGITAMLKRTDGVFTGAVSYEKREALVEYDAQKISPEKIAEVIENLGYKATIKK